VKLLIAIVKPFRAREVLAALDALELHAESVREVMGFNRQKERLHRYLGSEYDSSFLPKIEIQVLVPDDAVGRTLRSITSSARTGRMGDGKILVLPCLENFISW
jgi:nitrogen regulatory protein PII